MRNPFLTSLVIARSILVRSYLLASGILRCGKCGGIDFPWEDSGQWLAILQAARRCAVRMRSVAMCAADRADRKFFRPVSVQGCCQWKQKEAASNCTTSICRRDCGSGISRRVGCGFRRRNGSEFGWTLCGRQASVNFWRWRTQSPLVVATSAGNNSLVSSSVQVSSDRCQASSTRVIVDNGSHENIEKFAVISVETSHRVGILQRITSTLNDLGLHILDAKVELAGATVEEKFYVTGARGEKISEAEDVRNVEIVLRAALHETEMEQPWDVPSGKTSVARQSAATEVSEAELHNKSRLLYRLMDQ